MVTFQHTEVSKSIESHLRYGIHLWGPMCSAKMFRGLRNLLKKAIRICKNVTPQGTKILKLDDLVKLKLAKISYRCVYDKISDTNSKCFTTSSSCIWPLLDDNVKRAKTVS